MKPLHWDAINPFTGTPFTFDDPNLRWGDPSYYLEPGDPGFVPYAGTAPTTQTKPRRMKRNAYYPTSVPEQILWLTNFFNKLLGHAPALGVSTTDCAAAVANARWLIYVLGSWLPAVRAWQKSCTDAAREAQLGSSAAPVPLPVFVPPPPPAADPGNPNLPAVVPRPSGALNSLFSLVQVIKEAPAYTESLGTDLGIIGAESAAPDPATFQPVLVVKRSGAHILVQWGWGGLRDHVDMLQIQVDRGTGGWTDLAYDTTPDYTDTHPQPATLATWKYRAIWRADDAQVGLWSAESTVTVGGS